MPPLWQRSRRSSAGDTDRAMVTQPAARSYGDQMTSSEPRSDADLLRATPADPQAFGLFYRRHVRSVLAYLMSRTARPDLAADICSEVFASALEKADRYDERRAPARAWLLSMASSRLVDAARRGVVEDRARKRLGMPVRELTDVDIERIEELGSSGPGVASELLAGLPLAQREAILARVVDERDYTEIAAELHCSEHVLRKRVSRGLSTMRVQLGKESGP